MDEFRSSSGGQVLENRVGLFLGKSVELLECRLALRCQHQFSVAAILF